MYASELFRAGKRPDAFADDLERESARTAYRRATDWRQTEGGSTRGASARVCLVRDAGVNLLEWRELQL